MINSIKKTGHLTNCFFFGGLFGVFALTSYYYFNNPAGKIILVIISIWNLFFLIGFGFGLGNLGAFLFGWFLGTVISGLLSMVIGAIVGEPEWKKI